MRPNTAHLAAGVARQIAAAGRAVRQRLRPFEHPRDGVGHGAGLPRVRRAVACRRRCVRATRELD